MNGGVDVPLDGEIAHATRFRLSDDGGVHRTCRCLLTKPTKYTNLVNSKLDIVLSSWAPRDAQQRQRRKFHVPKLSDDAEELLLAISAGGFGWIAQIARSEILAGEKAQTLANDKMSDLSAAAQLDVIQSVLDRFDGSDQAT